MIKGQAVKSALKLVFTRQDDTAIGFDRHGKAHFDAAQRAIDANAARAQANGPRSTIGALIRLMIAQASGLRSSFGIASSQIAARCGSGKVCRKLPEIWSKYMIFMEFYDFMLVRVLGEKAAILMKISPAARILG